MIRSIGLLFCALALVASNACLGDDGDLLRSAAQRGDVAGVKAILERNSDINAATSYGVTALSIACDHGHLEVVKVLVASGAEINTKDRFYKFSPIGWAAMRKHNEITRFLIQAGATDLDGVLGSAIGMQQVDIVQAILHSGKASEKAIVDSVRAVKAMKARTEDATTLDTMLALLEEHLSDEAKAKMEKDDREQSEAKRWQEFEGTYKSESSSVTVKVVEGRLTASEGDSERPIPLEATDKDIFTSRGLVVEFLREADAIKSIKWTAGENARRFERSTDTPLAATESTGTTPTTTQSLEDFAFDSANWPQFRGTLSRGIGVGLPIATTWNGTDGTNVAWKTPIPGLGTSSPVVWGDRVLVTTAVQASDASGFRTGQYGDVESVESTGECSYRTLCIDLMTGEIVWERESANEVPKVKRHAKSSHANPTPATDGQHVIAMFGGAGIYCYDMTGQLLWSRDLGMLDSGWFYDRSYQWGFGSSPCIFEDMVIVQCDVQEGAFIAALDLKTGESRWQTARDEIPSWSSPVAFMAKDGTPTVIATGTKCTAAYHARTGECLWRMGGFSEIVVPTPQVLPELSLLTSGYAPVQPIMALRHSARGELKIPENPTSDSPFLWAQLRGGPYMPTPLVYNQQVYILDNSGVLTAMELSSGKRHFRQRLRAEKANAYSGSPVAAGEHLYCISEEGLAFVVAMDGKGTIVAQNDLGEAVLSTPAISQGKLLIRGDKHLYCIEQPAPGTP